jgi:hypothetical protein
MSFDEAYGSKKTAFNWIDDNMRARTNPKQTVKFPLKLNFINFSPLILNIYKWANRTW